MRLLIVEDEKRIALAIKRVMESHNYAVDIVSDADNGLTSAIDPDYDLVILDRMLPGSMDGIEISRKVRDSGVHTPVLMLTALGEVDEKVRGLQAGADDYLTKPFSMKELLARVQVLLRRPPLSLSTIIQNSDLNINTDNFEVTRAGKLIKLSSHEFKLLVYLAHHQLQIISKDKIINHVWDGDSVIMPNTIEVYVGHLRKKIDRAFPGSPALIHTVHGFGYKFGANV